MKYGDHDASRYDDSFSSQPNGKNKKKTPDVRRGGEAIVVPKDLPLERVIHTLERTLAQEETERCIMEPISVSPHEGALALSKAMFDVFGVAVGSGSDISIAVGVNETTKVRWGQYELPMGGFVETGTATEDGRLIFRLHAHVKGKHEHAIRNLIDKIRYFATECSPYKGKAFNIILTDDNNQTLQMPNIKFLDLGAGDVTVIVRDEIERDFRTCIWGPIRFTDTVRKMGTPLRRGILLAGEYGTGKTLTAQKTAQIATKHGWTFLYLPKASDLPAALNIARQYEPCVVFVEDVDRITGTNRTESVNTVINALDGIGNKNSEVMVVFTTNHPELINAAMRRPGRIDTAINLLPPDGPTAERLLRHYAGTYLAPDQDLAALGEQLSGTIPAQLREVVERAKLAVGSEGSENIVIKTEDLEYAAGFIKRERELFKSDSDENPQNTKDFVNRLGHALLQTQSNNGGNGRSNGNGKVETAKAV